MEPQGGYRGRITVSRGAATPTERVVAGRPPIRIRNAKVARSLDLAEKRVLDLGCGSGLYSLYMADSAREVVGVDHSRSAIRLAEERRQSLGYANVTFMVADVRDDRLFQSLPHFDLVVAWGFLHRISDLFATLHKLSEITDAFSFEWPTAIFPFMGRASLAFHPTEGEALDPTNLIAHSDLRTDEDVRATKIQGGTGFWCPTPFAVATMMRRWGYKNARVLGYGDNFASGTQMIIRQLARAFIRGSGVAYARVHMIVERSPGLVKFKYQRLHDAEVPTWDTAAQVYMKHVKPE